MTEKQQRILDKALELFSVQGYHAVSTSRIAKEAGVSEGLIFRHFTNKKGLLKAIILDVDKRIGILLAPIIFEDDPGQVLLKTIELPFSVDESQYDYWRFQFKLKWDQEYHNPDKMKPLLDKLTWAFSKLGYAQPALEARLFNQILDSISVHILREGKESQKEMKAFLKKKYNLSHSH